MEPCDQEVPHTEEPTVKRGRGRPRKRSLLNTGIYTPLPGDEARLYEMVVMLPPLPNLDRMQVSQAISELKRHMHQVMWFRTYRGFESRQDHPAAISLEQRRDELDNMHIELFSKLVSYLCNQMPANLRGFLADVLRTTINEENSQRETELYSGGPESESDFSDATWLAWSSQVLTLNQTMKEAEHNWDQSDIAIERYHAVVNARFDLAERIVGEITKNLDEDLRRFVKGVMIDLSPSDDYCDWWDSEETQSEWLLPNYNDWDTVIHLTRYAN